jgi:hypothetical protein
MEAHSRVTHTEAGEEPHAALFLQTHKSPLHCWQTFEKILFSSVLREVNKRGLLRDEQFGFRTTHSITLHLARLVERVNRNFDDRRITGAVFLNVAKAFDTVRV